MPADHVANQKTLLDHGDIPARERATTIIQDAIEAVQPERLLADRLALSSGAEAILIDGDPIHLDAIDSVTVVGAGKGSRRLVEAVLGQIGAVVDDGLVVEKHGQGEPLPGISVRDAGHPVPDADSLAAGRAVLAIADAAGADDLVIYAITGGASALLAAPAPGLDLMDLVSVNEALLAAGAPIEDLNTVRKHLSALKGGRLTQRTAPAPLVTLVVVDEVAGAPWGPTVPDGTTFADAITAAKRHGVWATFPTAVREHLEAGVADPTRETPDAAALSDRDHRVVVLADATDLCDAARAAAERADLEAVVLSSVIEGESREVGTVLAGVAREIRARGQPIAPPCALISGGETTVTVTDPVSPGSGGPNQELALSAARRLTGLGGVALAVVDSDGTDGPTDRAGGLVDGTTVSRARELGVDLEAALSRHDATAALEALDDAVILREPGTNLMDLRVLVVLD